MGDISNSMKLAFTLLGLGLVLDLIGFSLPYWHVNTYVSFGYQFTLEYGLWKLCLEKRRFQSMSVDLCTSLITGDHARDYIRATQFFETVGLIAAIVSIVLLLLGVCVATCRDRRILPILSGICSIAAAGCILLGTVIFGAKDEEQNHLSWAFALCIVGGIFFGVAGVLVIVASVVLKR